MASGFWGVTGFFIVLEVAMALGVQFSGAKKDDKQCVWDLCRCAGDLWHLSWSHTAPTHCWLQRSSLTILCPLCRLKHLLCSLTVICCWLL